jgi:uncharacterized protein
MYAADPDKRKLLSALSHGSIFLNATVVAIGIPIGVLMISDDSVVKENAKEALNFHLNVGLINIILGVVMFLTLGLAIPIVGLWFLVHWGLTIWAILSSLKNTEVPFRYPFIFRIL